MSGRHNIKMRRASVFVPAAKASRLLEGAVFNDSDMNDDFFTYLSKCAYQVLNNVNFLSVRIYFLSYLGQLLFKGRS